MGWGSVRHLNPNSCTNNLTLTTFLAIFETDEYLALKLASLALLYYADT